MTLKQTAMVTCLSLLFFLAGFIAGGTSEFQNQYRIERTRVNLFTIAVASTNYFSKRQVWPQSIQDLISNKFLIEDPFSSLGSGATNVYEPFNQTAGYGSVRSTNVWPKSVFHRKSPNLAFRFGLNDISEIP
jgi:hypothetical protein